MSNYVSAGDQLVGLQGSLQKKLDSVQGKIDADNTVRDSLVKEVKSLTKQLEVVDARLTTVKAAWKEYMKTIGELDFALGKIEEGARGMEDKFAGLSRLNADD